MEKTTEELELKRIIDQIKEGRANGISASEILLAIDDIRPTRVIVKTPEPKTSPERLEYLKQYRKMRKELEQLKSKQNKKELAKQKKITQALKREGFFCYKCKSPIRCIPEHNKHSFEKKRGHNKIKIIISNQCPSCNTEVRQFGGYL